LESFQKVKKLLPQIETCKHSLMKT